MINWTWEQITFLKSIFKIPYVIISAIRLHLSHKNNYNEFGKGIGKKKQSPM
jgi:hypothetical protein